jgi:HSP20 family protein
MSWNLFDELVHLHDRAQPARNLGGAWIPPVDVYETAANYVLVAELPGFSAKEFSVDVTASSVTLTGHRTGMPSRTQQYVRLERGQGPFSRSFTFPEAIDTERISADFTDGVLTVTMPKAAGAGARRIDIG